MAFEVSQLCDSWLLASWRAPERLGDGLTDASWPGLPMMEGYVLLPATDHVLSTLLGSHRDDRSVQESWQLDSTRHESDFGN